MKTILILALIAAVCMCSGGDVFGTVKPGKSEEDKPSSSVGDEKSGQDDGQIGRDCIKGYKTDGKIEMERRVTERANQEKLLIKQINEILENQGLLKKDDRAKIKSFICGTFGLKEENIDDNLVMNILRTMSSNIPTLRSFLERAALKDPVQGEKLEKFSKFTANVLRELKKDSITASSDTSENPDSSSRKSGDNQRGVDGIQDKGKGKQEENGESVAKNSPEEPSGATVAFSKDGKIFMQDENMHQENAVRDPEIAATKEDGQRCTVS
jgi:hypothetical protein